MTAWEEQLYKVQARNRSRWHRLTQWVLDRLHRIW